MILFLSMSTADQRIWLFSEFHNGEVNRSKKVVHCVGGKAVNAARAASIIGSDSVLTGFFGHTQGLVELLNSEGITVDPVLTQKPSRRATTVINLSTGEVSELVEESFLPGKEELESLERIFLEYAGKAGIICLCGSIALELPQDFYARLMEKVPGGKFIVDAQGDNLKSVLCKKPFLVKPNRRELETIIGKRAESLLELAGQAQELRRLGAENVAVGCGSAGVLFAGKDRTAIFRPPGVEVKNSTGCGDVITGVLAHAFSLGMNIDAAFKLAVASASASACDFIPGSFTLEKERLLLEQIRVEDFV